MVHILLWSEEQIGPVQCKRISECSLNSLGARQPDDKTNISLIENPSTFSFCRLVVCLPILLHWSPSNCRD